MVRLAAALAFLFAVLAPAFATAQQDAEASLEPVRVGVLKYGTVNWELDAMTRAELDAANGVHVEIVPFASESASNVALQAGSVDVIVSDWLWVSRQRAMGADFTFAPYSTSVGSLMVPQASDIRSIKDLKGRTIGVAGGPLDKNWLLIQALARKNDGIDLSSANDIVYGAPPLLAEKARSGELDGVLNYWHYAARLEADGFRTLISGTDAAKALGTKGPVASIGWVFRDAFAKDHPRAVDGFLAADKATKTLLASSDASWEPLKPMMNADSPAAFRILVERYREGIPARTSSEEARDAETLYALLSAIGGERLVGPGKTLAPGTYYDGSAHGG